MQFRSLIVHFSSATLSLTSSNFRFPLMQNPGLVLLKSSVFFSSNVLILVKFADLRSTQSVCDLVFLTLWPLFLWGASPILSGFDIIGPVTRVFAWLLRSLLYRIGAWAYSLTLLLLAGYGDPVLSFGNQILAHGSSVQARFLFSLGITSPEISASTSSSACNGLVSFLFLLCVSHAVLRYVSFTLYPSFPVFRFLCIVGMLVLCIFMTP